MATKPSKRSPKPRQPNNDFNQQGGDPPMWAEREVEKHFVRQARPTKPMPKPEKE